MGKARVPRPARTLGPEHGRVLRHLHRADRPPLRAVVGCSTGPPDYPPAGSQPPALAVRCRLWPDERWPQAVVAE